MSADVDAAREALIDALFAASDKPLVAAFEAAIRAEAGATIRAEMNEPQTKTGQALARLLAEADVQWPDGFTRISPDAIAEQIAKAEVEAMPTREELARALIASSYSDVYDPLREGTGGQAALHHADVILQRLAER